MTYEFVKQLKDGGFPMQETHNPDVAMHLGFCKFTENGKDTSYLRPTLSELIEACGDRLNSIIHLNGLWTVYGYHLDSNGNFRSVYLLAEAPDLETALGKFWLALHKKD